MSSFSGLSIGLSALNAQRRAIEVAGHNIANVNTEGYSRQRVVFDAVGGPTVPAMHAQWTGGGNGVRVHDVERLRDDFLEARAQREHGIGRALTQTQGVLGRIELSFGEPGENGLQAQLSDFWSGWDDVANHPDALAARRQLLERSRTLATGLNSTAAGLGAQWEGTREELTALVAEVNATANQVAGLNGAITNADNAGLPSNDLADERDRLILHLGELVGATTRAGGGGSVDVYLGGTTLVRGDRAQGLTVDAAADFADVPAGGTVAVRWQQDGYAAAVTGGTAGGMLGALNDVLPRYRDDLDEVATALIDVVNTRHGLGFDQAGDAGVDYFAADPARAAATIHLAINDPTLVAASESGPDANGDPVIGGANAAELAEAASLDGGPDESYRTLIVNLGIETQAADRRGAIHGEITDQVDAARQAQSGVSIDEEMVHLVSYQHAYAGAARFVTAIDEMLNTLINRTGLVGR